MGEGLKEACGLFGIYGHSDAAYLAYFGLWSLQHRGQESCGIVSSDGERLHKRIRMGLVPDNFSEKNFPDGKGNGNRLYGPIANAHVRYSTTGKPSIENAQPMVMDTKYGEIAIAHNGNLTNYQTLRRQFMNSGSIFKSTADSELIGHLISHSDAQTLEGAIADALQQVEGAYSLVLTSKDTLYAARDRYGFKPLVLGRKDKAVVVASETCALDVVGAIFERKLEPGELIRVDEKTKQNGVYASKKFVAPEQIKPASCIFEYVYFARPDHLANGHTVATLRKAFGRQLAREHPVDADVVTCVPDSGRYAALGFAEESGIKYDEDYVRTHYSGRTFTSPKKSARANLVRLKLNVIKDLVKDKRVVVVDDSVIRGNTSRNRITQLKEAGAKEVHLRISCPPTRHPCFYGIDFPDPKELIAANNSIDEICKLIGADSLGYLSLEGMLEAAKGVDAGYCTACWTGKYPTELDDLKAGLVQLTKC